MSYANPGSACWSRRGVLTAAGLSAGVVALPAQPSFAASASANPLATPDQRYVDGVALAVLRSMGFADSKATARASYLLGRAGLVPPGGAARLTNAVDELLFGMIQTAANCDAFRPRVYWLGCGAHTWLGAQVPGGRWAYDNPDTIYRTVPIDPASHYIIRGRLLGSGTTDLAFSLIDDLITQTTVDYVDGLTLRDQANPTYTVTVGPEPANGRTNHLQTTNRTVQLFIRTTIADWENELPDALEVERTDPGSLPGPPTVGEIAQQAKILMMRGAPIFGPALLGLKTMAKLPNTRPKPGTTPGALVTQANSFGYFRLCDDEALVVRLDPGGAKYVTLPVTDPWMVGIDPGGTQSSLNNAQALRDPDGSYTFIVSKRDPGFQNWVSTAGASEGTIMARWQRLSPTGKPAIEAKVVPLRRLSAELPTGTPTVTDADRLLQLIRRSRAYNSRFTD